ncbi:PLP-dependent transferase [Alisedimentitalea sp. MJ-SS2]|uniref:PLP-dependent transferase n=1 Tax=Aliisedimentitalea sp. MJ-SS2 TaxID=3049795 RepID=UPI0029075188|nr:PLP-dependent transferase [Alisedimentitalea sp. MJ-SS2]MDU8929130.1 PLP-dependent transferase [Alisedimentitalea sp. MJ-SS2]
MSDTSKTRLFDMLHHRSARLAKGDPVPDPLVMSSVFALPEQPEPSRTYGRGSSPTLEALEQRLAHLEAAPCLSFPSGMGAYAGLLMAALKQGDRVLLLSDGYYAARNLVSEVLAPFGVQLATCPADTIADTDLTGFAMVIIETPSNPGLTVIDIDALAARCRTAGAMLAVDNTVCTPLLQNPLDLGADAVIVSDTKAMGGHSDLLMGHVASRNTALMERVQSVRTLMGLNPGPQEAWMLIRGLETLEIRLERMCSNARALLPVLKASPHTSDVTYPEPHPQTSDQGFLIGLRFTDAATADRFLELAGFAPTTSFGGLHSSGDRRARWGDDVSGGFLRLSIGIEPTAQLQAAVSSALSAL